MTVEIQALYSCFRDACICYCLLRCLQDGLPTAVSGTGASLRAPRGDNQQQRRRRRHYFARVDSEEEEEEEEEQLSDGDMQLSHPGDS